MSTQPLLSEPDRIEEPQKVQEYWDLMSRVASTHHPVIVRRGDADVVAVIAVKHLELLQEMVAQAVRWQVDFAWHSLSERVRGFPQGLWGTLTLR